MKDLFNTALATLAVTAFTVSGCTDAPDNSQFTEVSAHDNEHPDEDPHAGHAHPTHGPHGGDLIELGNEEFHAELLHPHGHDHATDHHAHGDQHADDAESKGHKDEVSHDEDAHEQDAITIYILDGTAEKVVPIAAKEVTLNLTPDGKPEQFKLTAMPDQGDPEGKSSRFVSSAQQLLEHFHDNDHVEGTLVLNIGGKSYRGKLTHNHHDDHGNHDGAHGHAH